MDTHVAKRNKDNYKDTYRDMNIHEEKSTNMNKHKEMNKHATTFSTMHKHKEK